MTDIFIVVVAVIVLSVSASYLIGKEDANKVMQEKCVAKYAEMPYNKVQEHCVELLKFKQ
jgi:hypothetical protein